MNTLFRKLWQWLWNRPAECYYINDKGEDCCLRDGHFGECRTRDGEEFE